ncbi:MAG: transcription antitermination factor NusB [Bacteroidota bacterium]
MLNRRILRVKAMQALYGYFTALESLKEVSKNELEKKHALDPAKHDFADKGLFETRKKLAVRLFSQNYLKEQVETSESVEADVLENVNDEIQDFQNKLASEVRVRRTEMLKDTNRIYDLYLKFLQLPIELEHIERLYVEKKKLNRPTPFVNNVVIEKLKASEVLEKELRQYHISWQDELDEIRSWYKQEITQSEPLQDYFRHQTDASSLILELFKKVMFKNENIVAYLENQNLHWSENQPIIKSMILKTIKSMTEGEDFELAELTKNGQDDFDFFQKLFDGVIKQDQFLDKLIASKTKNWDVDRIAITDRVILKLALVEMMVCPSIPMKVSINEAIEISKMYSTPKSKQFINGILDVLSNELSSTGKVRKSGRGLIDNK